MTKSWASRWTPAEDRFWLRVDASGDCWDWTGAHLEEGYGVIAVNGKSVGAHRFAWMTLVGPIPEGYQLDHLCRRPSCVNPDHLEPVPPRTNQLRGYGLAGINARKTTCPRGHAYSGTNYIGRRICHTCDRDKQRHFRARKAA